jgi:flavin reductase (DIM6/NTAB) family NADH-FMN oxidoreductase RutF
MSYFTDEYKEQVLFLGSKSGRDSEKMKEVELTSVQTPSGDITFKEAGLIIECILTGISIANPGDFYSPEAKEYINKAYRELGDYRKYVFGEITCVWVRNKN